MREEEKAVQCGREDVIGLSEESGGVDKAETRPTRMSEVGANAALEVALPQ